MSAHSSGLLDPALAAFIASRISVQIAACDGRGPATLVRGLGCRVSDDLRTVTVLMPRSQALPVLAAIEANGRVAAVFSEPETHRTVQLKGVDARVEAATAEDEAGLLPYAAAMAARLAPFRVPEIYARTLFSGSADDLVAVSFTPSQGFGQTPGPRAGMPLADGKP